jgi:tRNA-modifying protein YgfZ
VVAEEALAAAYARLGAAGEGAGVPGACALLWVEGPEAGRFLQGLLTNDVLRLGPGESTYALLLTNRGRVRGDLRVVRDGEEAFTLVIEASQAPTLAQALEEMHFGERLDLIGPEPFELLTVGGGAPPSAVGDVTLPGLVPGTTDVVTADARGVLAALGLPEAPAEALEALRLEAGVPRFGADLTETSLVQEAGLERVAVSFDKGCYLGQETVARTQYRGHVNRLLRGLLLPAPAPVGAVVRAGDREVGRLSSVALSPARGPIALAVLRREVGAGDEVSVDGLDRPARVVELPFP